MNKYEKKYQKIINNYIGKGFTELKKYKIEIKEVENKSYYALAFYKKPGVFTIKIGKKVRKWSLNSIKAMLAHELGHFIIYRKVGFLLTRISDFLESYFRFFKRLQERKADKIAIRRGCGKCMLKSRKKLKKKKQETKKGIKKPVYLTAKEIEQEIRKNDNRN